MRLCGKSFLTTKMQGREGAQGTSLLAQPPKNHSTFKIQHSAYKTQYSLLNIQYSPTFALYKDTKEGNDYRSLLLFYMVNETAIWEIEKMLNSILAEEPEYFSVSVKMKPTNNIKIFIDGDNGITIEKCVRFNRKLYKLIEEAGMYPEGEFSLEVSSPGLDEPLKMHRQYLKNIGRDVELTFADDTKKEGKLLAVTEADITIEHTEGKGKKAVTQQLAIPFSNIKATTVQIKF